jgi:hypothetical protein
MKHTKSIFEFSAAKGIYQVIYTPKEEYTDYTVEVRLNGEFLHGFTSLPYSSAAKNPTKSHAKSMVTEAIKAHKLTKIK